MAFISVYHETPENAEAKIQRHQHVKDVKTVKKINLQHEEKVPYHYTQCCTHFIKWLSKLQSMSQGYLSRIKVPQDWIELSWERYVASPLIAISSYIQNVQVQEDHDRKGTASGGHLTCSDGATIANCFHFEKRLQAPILCGLQKTQHSPRVRFLSHSAYGPVGRLVSRLNDLLDIQSEQQLLASRN